MIKYIYLTIATVILSSCYSYLPHSNIVEANSTIPHTVYTGKDSSHFFGGVGYSESVVYSSEEFEFQSPQSNQTLRAAIFEFGWSKTSKSYVLAGALAGNFGNYNFISTNQSTLKYTFGNLTLKGQAGLPVHFQNFTLFPVYGGVSFSKDFGKYPELRNELNLNLDQDSESIVVSQDAIATTFTVGPQFVFFTTKDFGFSINPTLVFNCGIDENGWHNYVINGRAEAIVRLKKFYLRLSMTILSKTYGWQLSLLYGF